jgi:hypothetical protein
LSELEGLAPFGGGAAAPAAKGRTATAKAERKRMTGSFAGQHSKIALAAKP